MQREQSITLGRASAGIVLGMMLLTNCDLPPKAAPADRVPIADYPQIATLEGLHDVVFVTEVVKEEGPPLKLTVTMRNNEDAERSVQYRFFFLKPGNVPEQADPDWHYARMAARTYTYMEGNAMDDEAVDWRLEIRPAR